MNSHPVLLVASARAVARKSLITRALPRLIHRTPPSITAARYIILGRRLQSTITKNTDIPPNAKVLYSTPPQNTPWVEEPKGTWRYYRNKIVSLSGGTPKHITFGSYAKWEAILTGKMIIWMGICIVLCSIIYYGVIILYSEWMYPTPKAFGDLRIMINYMNYELEVTKDLGWAGWYGKLIMGYLEEHMKRKGEWETRDIEWKKAYVDMAMKIADIWAKLGKNDDSYQLYRRLTRIEPEVIDDRRRSEAFFKMGQDAVALKQNEEALDLYQKSIQNALKAQRGGDTLHLNIEKPVLPPPENGGPILSVELICAIQSTAIQYSRLNRPNDSLPIFLALLRYIQAAPDRKRDLCREASIMAYLGEIVWALGKYEDGLSWTLRALDESEYQARDSRTCKDCAEYAVKNAMTMTRAIGVVSSRAKWRNQEQVDAEITDLKEREEDIGTIRGLRKKELKKKMVPTGTTA